MTDHLAVAAGSYGADFDRRVASVTRREPARLLDSGVLTEALLVTVPGGRGDGQR